MNKMKNWIKSCDKLGLYLHEIKLGDVIQGNTYL